MLNELKKSNPNLPLYSVNDAAFLLYGNVIKNYDVHEVINTALRIEMPESGSRYQLSLPQLEACQLTEKLKNECFGESEIQVGYCWGYNDMLNGMEYHKSSEINIAVTPMILLLGHISDIENNKYNSEKVKAFFADAGEIIEIYGSTLHFCPCQVNKSGFRSIVILPKGTNAPLNKNEMKGLLFRQNKWLICHEKNEPFIERGVYPGIHGENIRFIGIRL